MKAMQAEINRISSLDAEKAEKGLRLCQGAPAHESAHQVKFRFKCDQSQVIEDETFFMQDLMVEALGILGGDVRTLPGPPGDKERRLRKMANARRIAIARKRR